jgi:hypothetical protein
MSHPTPRSDGLCCSCTKKPAVTSDGRYCKKCLKSIIVKLTPMTGCYGKRGEGQPRYDEGSNSFDNAVKVQEG